MARTTSAWVAELSSQWTTLLRAPHNEDTVDNTPSGRLVTLVTNTVATMFTVHNSVCRARINPEYQVRSRDVVPNMPRASTRAQARADNAEVKAQRTLARREKTKLLSAVRIARATVKVQQMVTKKVLQAEMGAVSAEMEATTLAAAAVLALAAATGATSLLSTASAATTRRLCTLAN